MINKLFVLACLTFWSLDSYAAGQETIELCVPEACAIRVTDSSNDDSDVWLVTHEDTPLLDLWSHATFWLVPLDEYEALSASLPDRNHIQMTVAKPGTRMGDLMIYLTFDAGGYAAAPRPSAGGKGVSVTGGAPLVNAPITVNVGNNDSCGLCHKGTAAEIHKRLLQKKTKGS